jgi:hypothetical protein
MDIAHAIIDAQVGVITDAPFLVQPEPDRVLIPALDAFGAEQDGAEGQPAKETHGEDENARGRADKPALSRIITGPSFRPASP